MIPYQPIWMDTAWEWLGIAEWLGPGESNPAIDGFHNSVADDDTPDDIAWCSSAANALMQGVGIEGTGSRAARSWLDWGVKLGHPAYGCICVLWRDTPDSWKGHVGIFLGFIAGPTGADVLLWGGNQGNEVSVKRYPASRVLGYRWPGPT